MNDNMTVCPFYRGAIQSGTTFFTARIGTGILLLEDVPAEICSQCGEKWFSDEVMGEIESIVEDVRKRRIKFEVIVFDAA